MDLHRNGHTLHQPYSLWDDVKMDPHGNALGEPQHTNRPVARPRGKACRCAKTALAMVLKLVEAAQKSWRRLDGRNQLPKLIQGVKFTGGIEAAVMQRM